MSAKKALNRKKPEILATGPNQVWSWDVSMIRSNDRLTWYYLYVIMDIWSRLVVGWKLEERQETGIAIKMWKEALEAQEITGKGLTNHKDNGSIMIAHEMVKFVKHSDMIDSYSRAGHSNDNPFSESLFKTIKYFRDYPDRVPSLEEGTAYFQNYFSDYNYKHRHSGIQFITPEQRHYGMEEGILKHRNKVIKKFYEENGHRYSGDPKVFIPIKEVGINLKTKK